MARVDALADAGPLPHEERCQHAVCEHDGAHLIGYAAGDVNRLVAARADRVHDSGSRLSHVIEGWLTAVRALGTVARSGRIDDPRILRAQRFPIESEPRSHA